MILAMAGTKAGNKSKAITRLLLLRLSHRSRRLGTTGAGITSDFSLGYRRRSVKNFMRYTSTDEAPRMAPAQPGERHRSGFESTLPPEALEEMLRRRVAKAPRQQYIPPWLQSILTLVGMISAPILLVAVGATLRVALTPRPVPAPTPAPPAQTLVAQSLESHVVPSPIRREPEVRRAELVPVPVYRAALWRLPSQELGVYKWYDLPESWGGGRVWARYMGTKGRFSEIPSNPVSGDMWNVTETGASWIYCVPIGYNHVAWIDP
jgi:hypothetical protein